MITRGNKKTENEQKDKLQKLKKHKTPKITDKEQDLPEMASKSEIGKIIFHLCYQLWLRRNCDDG